MSILFPFYLNVKNTTNMQERNEMLYNLIENSNSFALLLRSRASEHETLSREALKIVLQSKEKKVYLSPNTPDSFKKKWSSLLSEENSTPLDYSTSIQIPKKQFKIKEVSYEEGDDNFNLNIVSENNGINASNVIFTPKPVPIDVVFCFGELEMEDWLNIGRKISTPEEQEKIISITPNPRTISEKINDLARAVNPESFEQTKLSTLLYASLHLETEKFTKNVTENVLSTGSWLVSAGVDQETISKIEEEGKNINFAQLTGRALARTRINKNLKSIWTFLSSKDLEKTGQKDDNPHLFYKISQEIQALVPSQPISLVLWQTKGGQILCLIRSSEQNSNLLQKIAERMGINVENNFFVTNSYTSFLEAEMKIQQALREII